ncbi:hypothetical protein HPP92_023286 [Vanilla planifolia]|uniref:Terpene synthase metal-binding domain-containing protein n=1 Tax=Vanilla planifolia TaxID=51239 RepID=A0A835PYT2_VANPL|nr:hypothetical protein HPP92_023584 [Vanilla planifolia]KAG0460158.1 hypothetical protein HPP92_023286 [Vanilla planifolia]
MKNSSSSPRLSKVGIAMQGFPIRNEMVHIRNYSESSRVSEKWTNNHRNSYGLYPFYTLLSDEASRETVAMLNNDTFKSFELIALSLRLWDDLGSAKDENQEGLDGSYLECYMKEYDASLESARKHAMEMISNAWKELNKECLLSNNFSQSFKQAMLNTVRMINVMYTYEDQRLPMLEEYSRLNLLEDI